MWDGEGFVQVEVVYVIVDVGELFLFDEGIKVCFVDVDLFVCFVDYVVDLLYVVFIDVVS